MDAIFPDHRVSQREYGILFEPDVKVPVRDGIKLSVNISLKTKEFMKLK